MTLSSADVAAYLTDHPDFFAEHADVLAELHVVSPHGARTISLQERQLEVLRERVRQHELKLAELIRFGQENEAITDKTTKLARRLFLERNAVMLPTALIDEIKLLFELPSAAVRLWNLAIGTDQPYAKAVAPDTRTFANGLMSPYCGANLKFEAVGWLPEADGTASIALVPLRIGAASEAFGLLVLGSSDANRFTSEMGTTYLARIGELASAALSRLLR